MRQTVENTGRVAVDAATKRRAASILRQLRSAYPNADCALLFTSPLELLVATILSAQCTDERVNKVTRTLFRDYPTAPDYANAARGDLETAIHSTGFFRNKAKSLQGMATALIERHDGNVPHTMAELVALPGVARKTANVVLGTAFGINDGVVVDTHVFRVARRLGLSEHEDATKIEQDLMAQFAQSNWTYLGHALIQHGRQVCHARKPACAECTLHKICPAADLT